MPRLTNPVGANFQKFRNYCKPTPPKYRVLLPPVLKDHISKNVHKGATTPCVTEMANLFACLKKNDYNEKACQDVIQKFEMCAQSTLFKVEQARSKKKQKAKTADSEPTGMKATNTLLKKYRQPPPDIKIK